MCPASRRHGLLRLQLRYDGFKALNETHGQPLNPVSHSLLVPRLRPGKTRGSLRLGRFRPSQRRPGSVASGVGIARGHHRKSFKRP